MAKENTKSSSFFFISSVDLEIKVAGVEEPKGQIAEGL